MLIMKRRMFMYLAVLLAAFLCVSCGGRTDDGQANSGSEGSSYERTEYTRSKKHRISEPSSIKLCYNDGIEERTLELSGEELQKVSDMIVMDWNTDPQDAIIQYMMRFPEDVEFTARLHYDDPISLDMLGGGKNISDIFISLDEGKDYFTVRNSNNTAYASHMRDGTIKYCRELINGEAAAVKTLRNEYDSFESLREVLSTEADASGLSAAADMIDRDIDGYTLDLVVYNEGTYIAAYFKKDGYTYDENYNGSQNERLSTIIYQVYLHSDADYALQMYYIEQGYKEVEIDGEFYYSMIESVDPNKICGRELAYVKDHRLLYVHLPGSIPISEITSDMLP